MPMTVDDPEAAFSTNSDTSIEAPVGPFPSVALPLDDANDFELTPLPLRGCRRFTFPCCSNCFPVSIKMSTNFAACAGMIAMPARIAADTISLPCDVTGAMSPKPTLFFVYYFDSYPKMQG